MIPALALASALPPLADGPGYRLTLRGNPGTRIYVRAQAPPGWLASFCGERVCRIGGIFIRIGASGAESFDLRMHARDGAVHGSAVVSAAASRVVLKI